MSFLLKDDLVQLKQTNKQKPKRKAGNKERLSSVMGFGQYQTH